MTHSALAENPRSDPAGGVFRVAFTGHRPSGEPWRTPADLARCRPAIRQHLDDLLGRARSVRKTLQFRCSAAAGADIEALEVAEEMGIAVHVVLPMPIERFAGDFGGIHEPYLPRAQRLIDKALRRDDEWSLDIVADIDRPACYEACDERLMDGASVLLAVWDGRPSTSPVGTARLIESARLRGFPVIVVHPS